MKKPSPYALKRAKRTLFGRILCRLVGEERGAVMMEYVVIGVLVVAAAVAMVQLFGGGIRTQFKAMLDALFGRKSNVTETIDAGRGKVDTEAPGAEEFGQHTSGESLE
jgi:Flp pilus assembly pilin Flp